MKYCGRYSGNDSKLQTSVIVYSQHFKAPQDSSSYYGK